VRKSGNRVRVTAQLINAISGTHIWADRYDHELDDIFAVQDAIATAIVGILDPELTGAEQQRVMRKPPDKRDAWETFQRGLWHFHKYTAADNKIAQTLYREVIGIDPGFAPGHYGLVNALLWEVWLYGARTAPEIQPECVRESRIAVALDDRDAVARALHGVVMLGEGEWDIGLAEARVAYSLNPNNGFVAAAVGKTAGFAGLQDEGIEYLRRAMRLSPRDPLTWGWLWWMAVFQFYAPDFAGALATLTRVAGMRAGFPYLYMFTAASLAFLDRHDEARAMFDRLRAEVPAWRRWVEDRPAWLRPEDYELRLEGMRRAAGTSFDTD
jgi:adenylate cyclase